MSAAWLRVCPGGRGPRASSLKHPNGGAASAGFVSIPVGDRRSLPIGGHAVASGRGFRGGAGGPGRSSGCCPHPGMSAGRVGASRATGDCPQPFERARRFVSGPCLMSPTILAGQCRWCPTSRCSPTSMPRWPGVGADARANAQAGDSRVFAWGGPHHLGSMPPTNPRLRAGVAWYGPLEHPPPPCKSAGAAWR